MCYFVLCTDATDLMTLLEWIAWVMSQISIYKHSWHTVCNVVRNPHKLRHAIIFSCWNRMDHLVDV